MFLYIQVSVDVIVTMLTGVSGYNCFNVYRCVAIIASMFGGACSYNCPDVCTSRRL